MDGKIASSPLSSLPPSPSDSVSNDDPQDKSVPPPATTEGGLTIMEQLLKFEEEKKQRSVAQEASGQKDQQDGKAGIVCGGSDVDHDKDVPQPNRRKTSAEENDDDLPGAKRRRVAETRKPETKVTIHVTPTPAKKSAMSTRKSAKDKKWEAPFVYTDEKSPITEADLRAILLLPQAWDILTEDEKKDILAKFPDDTHIQDAGTANARPNIDSLRNDDDFRHDCARYVENIELGKHDEDWLYQAWVAHKKHKRGDFDSFLRKSFEDEWGVKLPKEDGDQSSSPSVGDSEEAKSPSASPSSVKNVKEEAGNAVTNDAPASKPDSGALPLTPASPTETQSHIPVVTKAKVVTKDSPAENTEQPTAVPEVAANGE